MCHLALQVICSFPTTSAIVTLFTRHHVAVKDANAQSVNANHRQGTFPLTSTILASLISIHCRSSRI